MRIARLDLVRYGHFSDLVLDFGTRGGGSDFHIVYGPNEAGKSTIVSAYLSLLYGIPERTPYAFRHERAALDVRAVLESEGARIPVRRIARRKGDLFGDGDDPVPEAYVARLLGGITRDIYRQVYCLDDESIEQGGEAILASKGDLGQLLFSAASGIDRLKAILDEVRKADAEFHQKNGRTKRLNKLRHEIEALGRQKSEAELTPAQHRKLRTRLNEAEADATAADAAHAALMAELASLRGLAEALPLMSERDAARAELASEPMCDQMPSDIPEGWSAEVQDLALTRAGLLAERATHTGRLRRLRAELAGAHAPDHRSDDAVAGAIATLGLSPETDLLRLCPTDVAVQELRDALETLERLEEHAETSRKECTAAEQGVAEARAARQKALDAATAPDGVDQLLDELAADRIAEALAQAKADEAAAARTLREVLRESPQAEALLKPKAAAPLTVSAARNLAEAMTTAGQTVQAHRDRLAEQQRLRAGMEAECGALQTALAGLSDLAAADARARRDALWQDFKETRSADAARRFEDALAETDRLADARLADAASVAAQRQSAIALSRHIAEQEATEAALRDAELRLDNLKETVHRHATKLGQIAEAAASDLVAWLELRDRAHRATAAHRDAVDAVAEAERRCAAAVERIVELLGPEIKSPRLDQALTAARKAAAASASEAKALAGSEAALAKAEETLERRASANRDTLAQLAAAESAWVAALGRLPAPPASGVPRRALVDALGHLAAYRSKSETRLAALERDASETQASLAAAEEALAGVEAAADRMRVAFPEAVDVAAFEALEQAIKAAGRVHALRATADGLARRIISLLGVTDMAEAAAHVGDRTAADIAAAIDSLTPRLQAASERRDAAIGARTLAETRLAGVGSDATSAQLEEERQTLLEVLRHESEGALVRRLGLRLADAAVSRYRERHRSRMLKETSEAFATLTDGSYVDLFTHPGDRGDVLLARRAADGRSIEAEAMSKGTRFQLYLALRLAGQRQLAANGTVLPFLCDDVFETFDEVRTAAACRLMSEISRHGQAIYLTHHAHVVEIARAVAGDRLTVHRLDPGTGQV